MRGGAGGDAVGRVFDSVFFLHQVSEAECEGALEETRWDVLSAIKYIKLKQLLSTQLAGVSKCKEALLRNKWQVEKAANYLLANPLSSPDECVDL